MEELLSNPAVQGGVAPFLAGLVIAIALSPVRASGLAVPAAFFLCVYLVSGIGFTPLTATRRLVLVAFAATCVGPILDFAFRPTAVAGVLVAFVAGLAGIWVFWPVFVQREASYALLLGSFVAALLALVAGYSITRLSSDPLRAGAAAFALGLGAGIAAFVGASLSYGLYGVGLAAGAGAFIVFQVAARNVGSAGRTLALPAMVIGILIACAAMLLAALPWYSVVFLALVPLSVRLPAPNGPGWLKASVCSLYGLVPAGIACVLAWPASSTT